MIIGKLRKWINPRKSEWQQLEASQIEVSIELFDKNDDEAYIKEVFTSFLEDIFYCSKLPEQYHIMTNSHKKLFLVPKNEVNSEPLDPKVLKWLNSRILYYLVKIEKRLKVKEVISNTPLKPLLAKKSAYLVNTLLPVTFPENLFVERGDRNEVIAHLKKEYEEIDRRLRQHKKELQDKTIIVLSKKFNDDIIRINDYVNSL